jgi:hypothetical protein
MAHPDGTGRAHRNAHWRCTEAPDQNAIDGYRDYFRRRCIVLLWLADFGHSLYDPKNGETGAYSGHPLSRAYRNARTTSAFNRRRPLTLTLERASGLQ